eukprot:511939-Rhodomonas_salina.1
MLVVCPINEGSFSSSVEPHELHRLDDYAADLIPWVPVKCFGFWANNFGGWSTKIAVSNLRVRGYLEAHPVLHRPVHVRNLLRSAKSHRQRVAKSQG